MSQGFAVVFMLLKRSVAHRTHPAVRQSSEAPWREKFAALGVWFWKKRHYLCSFWTWSTVKRLEWSGRLRGRWCSIGWVFFPKWCAFPTRFHVWNTKSTSCSGWLVFAKRTNVNGMTTNWPIKFYNSRPSVARRVLIIAYKFAFQIFFGRHRRCGVKVHIEI